jgi:hypothetical protein
MRPTGDLAAYLNDYFASEAWRPAADLLGNITLSQADDFIRTLPLCNGLQNSQFDFSRPPGIAAAANDTVSVRIPGVAAHHLETEVNITSPLPNAHLAVDFEVDLVASAGAPNPNINISSSFHWGNALTDFAAALLGVLGPKRAIEDAVGRLLPLVLSPKLHNQISAIGSYRFDRTRDLQFANPAAPISGVFANSFRGSVDPQQRGYCDLLVVADGYVAGNIGDFDTLVTAIVNYLAAAPEIPFQNFSTGIRIWTTRLVAAAPAELRERTIVPVQTADRVTMNFANLARIAEIGLNARAYFGRDPITIFASLISAADRANAGMIPANADLRENSQGPFVLLDTSRPVADGVDTLIHELGHTPLGRYLTDEYGSGTNSTYHGLEPRSRNVSVNPITGWAKWQPWSSSLLSFIPADFARESAYDFDRGIFRFADSCRMRTSWGGAFCKVCVEELTLGMTQRGHQAAGVNGGSGMADLLVEYLSPWTEAQPRQVHIEGGNSEALDVFDGGPNDSTVTRVRLTLAGSSVPQNWQAQWTVADTDGRGTNAQLSGNQIDVFLVLGSTIQLTITHDLATGLLASSRTPPSATVQLNFNQPRRVAAPNLQPPVKLIQSPALGEVIQPVVDQNTGAVTLPNPLWLAADIGGVQGFDLLTEIQFQITGQAGHPLSGRSNWGRRGDHRQWNISGMPASDRYTWSAATVWNTMVGNAVQAARAANGFCFEIAPVPFVAAVRPPVDPFALTIDETATFPSLPSGVRATSWSPNDRTIMFQFEVKLLATAFDGLNLQQTALLHRDPANFDSLAITGDVALNVFPASGSDFYHWRVRAVDDRGQNSNWVEGPQFALYLVAQRPTTLANLVATLDKLNPDVLQRIIGLGPTDIPRIYMFNQWQPPDKDTDFSGLEKLRPPK